MPELPDASMPEKPQTTKDAGSPIDDPPSPGQGRTVNPKWWAVPNFTHLVIWWIVLIGYYAAFNSISGRYHKGLIDPDLLSGSWYVILASGLIGAIYARQARRLWFLISLVLSALILLLVMIGLGALKFLLNP